MGQTSNHKLPGDAPKKGRGAVTNRSGRFETLAHSEIDDGWPSSTEDQDFHPPPLATSVSIDSTRSIIARNQSPDIPFDRSINPYRGCEHGCVYCFARPSHAWLGLSAGLDFETRLFAKPNAAQLLEKELAKRSYKPAVIVLGTNTDPYQPIERRYRITRQVLEVLWRSRHPAVIITKSAGLVRDLDILTPMAEARLVQVMISVTTLDSDLARRMEPRASAPAKRLAAVKRLADAGVPVGVMAAPMIPALNDSELEAILAAAAEAGAGSAAYVLLRLPLELKDLFIEWLEAHYPGRKDHVLSLIRQSRGGGLNDATFGRRFRGSGAYAALLARRFNLACRRLGLDQRDRNQADWGLNTDLFRGSPLQNSPRHDPRLEKRQLSLF